MDKYTLPLDARKQILKEQIFESQKIMFRNDVENLTFNRENNKARMGEVKINNQILREKIDDLTTELARLENETPTGGDSTIPRAAI